MSIHPVCFRLDAGTKSRLEAAARARGQSLTTFLREAAIKAIEAVEKRPPKPPERRRDFQDWCIALCCEARQGGASGYYRAGRSVLGKLVTFDAYGLRETEGQRRVRELVVLIQARDHAGMWAWFKRELPRCIEWVPPRRRELFLKGVLDECEGNPPDEFQS
jgi:hypothetical protein